MSKMPYRNSEGYTDPTAHAALEPIAQEDAALQREEKRRQARCLTIEK